MDASHLESRFDPAEVQSTGRRQCHTTARSSGMAFPVTSGPSMEILGGMSGDIFWPEEVPPVVVGSPLWRAKRPVKCPWGYSWTSREKRKCSRIKYHARALEQEARKELFINYFPKFFKETAEAGRSLQKQERPKRTKELLESQMLLLQTNGSVREDS
ncbi:Hypothetical predicted protein [Drosophila guanche]|uniref:Uncharacterized protein n=1 Tax=Drosophila guanche TaxID=7266 RepID=A0A3B0JN19_DROGU|nr:Hypothetical predicted protein [Drosophila guanche]